MAALQLGEPLQELVVFLVFEIAHDVLELSGEGRERVARLKECFGCHCRGAFARSRVLLNSTH